MFSNYLGYDESENLLIAFFTASHNAEKKYLTAYKNHITTFMTDITKLNLLGRAHAFKLLGVLLLLGCFQQSHAQVSELEGLTDLFELEAYHKIITDYKDRLDEVEPEIALIVGKSYFMSENDEKCIEIMTAVINETDSLPLAYFYRAQSFLYSGNANEALKDIKEAVKLAPDDPYFHSLNGDIYAQLEEPEKALESYINSIKDEPNDRSLSIITQLYYELGKVPEALSTGYVAKASISSDSPYYIGLLFNLALFESEERNFTQAEELLLELLKISPNDYQAHSKLIQVYYGLEEYEKSEPYKENLYKAHKNKELPKRMMDMFCIAQFEWNDYEIQVYERFEDNTERLYYKHIFYLLEDGEIIDQIQSENSPVALALGSPRYAVGRDKGNSHFTYGFIEDGYDYDLLKGYVLSILNEDVNAAASSSKGKVEISDSKSNKKAKRKKKKKTK